MVVHSKVSGDIAQINIVKIHEEVHNLFGKHVCVFCNSFGVIDSGKCIFFTIKIQSIDDRQRSSNGSFITPSYGD